LINTVSSSNDKVRPKTGGTWAKYENQPVSASVEVKTDSKRGLGRSVSISLSNLNSFKQNLIATSKKAEPSAIRPGLTKILEEEELES
jgi:hypothetical protein